MYDKGDLLLVFLCAIPLTILVRHWRFIVTTSPRLIAWALLPTVLFLSHAKENARWREQDAIIEAWNLREKRAYTLAKEKTAPCGVPILYINTAMATLEFVQRGMYSERPRVEQSVAKAAEVALEHCGGSLGRYLPLDLRGYLPTGLTLEVSRGGHIVRKEEL